MIRQRLIYGIEPTRAARRRCGVTLRAAGEAAGGMKPAAVDIAIRRLEQRAEQDPALVNARRELLLRIDGKCCMLNTDP